MFVWISSDSSRSGFGGCGLSFLMSMLLCMFTVSGNNSILLLLVLISLFVFFMLPRPTAKGPVYGDADDDKRKNEEYFDKPKRDDQYIIGADGDILNIIDEEVPDYNQSRPDNRY